MSITLSEPASAALKNKQRSRPIGLAIAVVLAGFVVLVVASLFEPLTDADRAEMLIDGTSGLPQDR